MTGNDQEQAAAFLELAGGIVSAYVSNNSLRAAELPALITSVHAALHGLASGTPQASAVEEVPKPTPSQIRKSITPDALISFIDGKPYKTLKRHLSTHGLDPYSYRQRYGLPNDYPMVAAAYAAQRSELAKSIGLGRPGAMAGAAQTSSGHRKAR
ncbi:MucR family transcriptional regulator [Methylobacterium oxalidis]|uniref:Transcriptional regulator n=1 Tax=Methylobacterium oxalidis TaxID=944322 RepID=A0A512J361_9HYPH|nr:MucR family transcriptional regulator [Methylobacterium oxalidis]GEP04380.1 transcriptional regulator [Methylobacterium oxalidis]GLS62752.1 transcriptional regulator [Methylobacterium oxalidis]